MDRVCENCGQIFDAKTRAKYCDDCKAAVAREKSRTWKKTHRKRCRDLNRRSRRRIRQAILDARGNKCFFCGTSKALEIHHRLHDSHTDDRQWKPHKKDIHDKNVRVLCFLCHRMLNRMKYLKRLGRLDEALKDI